METMEDSKSDKEILSIWSNMLKRALNSVWIRKVATFYVTQINQTAKTSVGTSDIHYETLKKKDCLSYYQWISQAW